MHVCHYACISIDMHDSLCIYIIYKYECSDIWFYRCVSMYIYMDVSHRGGLLDNKVFHSCSRHLSSNDRGNYQLKFPLSLFGKSDLQKMVIQFSP